MISGKPEKKKNKKKKSTKKKKKQVVDSEEEYILSNRVPFTLRSFSERLWGEEVVQCCMASCSDTCNEDESEVDVVALHSGHQLSPLKEKSKGKELVSKETSQKTSSDEEIQKSPKKSKGVQEKMKKDSIPKMPTSNGKAPPKGKIQYDIVNHLKRIPACQVRALIQALTNPDEYKDQIDPIEVDQLSLSPPIYCASCMACITFSDQDL
ncbi:hypothetical protein V2J09_021284 [Rumex salicifolius]